MHVAENLQPIVRNHGGKLLIHRQGSIEAVLKNLALLLDKISIKHDCLSTTHVVKSSSVPLLQMGVVTYQMRVLRLVQSSVDAELMHGRSGCLFHYISLVSEFERFDCRRFRCIVVRLFVRSAQTKLCAILLCQAFA